MKNFCKYLLFAVAPFLSSISAFAAHSSSYDVGKLNSDMTFIAQELMGRGVSVSPYGKFVGTTSGDQIGWYSNLTSEVVSHFTNGVILSTGDIIQGPEYTNKSASFSWGGAEMMNFEGAQDAD